MSAISLIIKNGLSLTTKLPTRTVAAKLRQKRVLTKLLKRSANTIFGREYGFAEIMKHHDFQDHFRERVPIHSYEDMHRWWRMSLEGEHSVCWPGAVQYFALSSGTSTGSSKYIPVTNSMLKMMQRSSLQQIKALANCKLPPSFFEGSIMMLGGSTSLDYNGVYYAGDLSGITTGNLPVWFQPFYKPGRAISATKDWQTKLDTISKEAARWDVSAIVGVPSWYQILLERIIKYHGLKNIHEMWPNLQVFVHGGVSFKPYRQAFESLLGKPLKYLETYLASEGFVAYQNNPEAEGMRMLLRYGIYYEFIPFTSENFDSDGNIKANATALLIDELEERKDYALCMSTCAGAWRYLIGDVIQFTDLEKDEIIIRGRTKHFLSLCGEHLSVDNMDKAIALTAKELNLDVVEYAVAGVPVDSLFGHTWYVGIDAGVDETNFARHLDEHLKVLNDDYRVERQHALKMVTVKRVDPQQFVRWLKSKGKEGAQVKFPRVLKQEQHQDWKNFISQ